MNKTSLFNVLVGFSIVCIGNIAARAGTIANWTFETSPPTTATQAPDVGTGSGTVFHAATGATYTNPSGNGSAESWNTNTWTIGDYFQFQVSTIGESGITFAWDQTRSTAGPGVLTPTAPNFRLQYSTDGAVFTDVVDYLTPTVTWNNTTADNSTKFFQDLSSISALDNQPAVYFRLTAILCASELGRTKSRG